MSREPLRIGIAGLGFGLQTYVPVIERLTNARICALADNGSGTAGKTVPLLKSPAQAYSSGQRMIEESDVDCVVIATPPTAQAKLVRCALERSLPVLCEKPGGISLEECTQLVALAEDTNIGAAIGFEYRYEAGIAGLIELVRKGEIGSIRHISISWRTGGALNPHRLRSWRDDPAQGGGILSEFCSHVFDYLAQLTGTPVSSMCCTTRSVVAERSEASGEISGVSAPDEVELECAFKNGFTATASVSNASSEGKGHFIEVQGHLGSAQFHHEGPFALGSARLTVDGASGRTSRPLPDTESFYGLDSRCPAVTLMIKDFLSLVHGGVPEQLASLRDSLYARQCIAAAERSAARGQWVSLHDDALSTRFGYA